MRTLLDKVLTGQKEARQAGFDWPDPQSVINKVKEELQELQESLAGGDEIAIIDEFGDVMLAVINLSLHLELDIETALEGALIKFKTRYKAMQSLALRQNIDFNQLDLSQKETLWQQAKKTLIDE